MLLILSFSLIFFFFLTFCLLPSFCRNFCFNYVILILPSKWHPFLLMQKLLSPWYINLQLGFNFEMFLHLMHYLSLDFFSWFVYLSSFLYSGDFLHMFPDPWWLFLFNNKALKFWLEALWSLVLAMSTPHSCGIGPNDGQSLWPQISMQRCQSLESFNFSRKKFSTLLHGAYPLVSNHLCKVGQRSWD